MASSSAAELKAPLERRVLAHTPGVVVCPSGLTAGELDLLIRHGDALPKESAPRKYAEVAAAKMPAFADVFLAMAKQECDADFAWLYEDQATAAVYTKVRDLIARVNAESFGFDLTGIGAPMQFTVYEEGQFYGWHSDMGAHTPVAHKLTLSLQLSDPAEYTGGTFETWVGHGRAPTAYPKERGTAILYPSYILHCVTPVTRGVRKSLIAWMTGPKFR